MCIYIYTPTMYVFICVYVCMRIVTCSPEYGRDPFAQDRPGRADSRLNLAGFFYKLRVLFVDLCGCPDSKSLLFWDLYSGV